MRDRRRRRRRCRWGQRRRSFVRYRHHCPHRDGDSPPLTAVKGVLPASRLPERHDDPLWKIVAIISTHLV